MRAYGEDAADLRPTASDLGSRAPPRRQSTKRSFPCPNHSRPRRRRRRRRRCGRFGTCAHCPSRRAERHGAALSAAGRRAALSGRAIPRSVPAQPAGRIARGARRDA
jgi:hypothetical protein